MRGIIRSYRQRFAVQTFAADQTGGSAAESGLKFDPDPVDSPTETIINDAVPLPPAIVAQAFGAISQASLIAAVKTAVAAVPGSSLLEIEYKDWNENWDVKVAVADGTTYKLKVSADGATVFKGPVVAGTAAPKQAKRSARLAQVQFDFGHALEIVTARYPNCQVVEVQLDTSKGRVVWEIEFITAEGGRREVKVDVATKEIVKDQIKN